MTTTAEPFPPELCTAPLAIAAMVESGVPLTLHLLASVCVAQDGGGIGGCTAKLAGPRKIVNMINSIKTMDLVLVCIVCKKSGMIKFFI